MSVVGVPKPLSAAFVKRMLRRYSEPGLQIPPLPGFAASVPKVTMLCALMGLLLARSRVVAMADWLLLSWAAAAYISWYILAYQHMLWHHMFDGLVFSWSFGLAIAMLFHRLIPIALPGPGKIGSWPGSSH